MIFSGELLAGNISLMLLAMLFECLFGWPQWLYRLVKHPVVWIGALIRLLESRLNDLARPDYLRQSLGLLTTIIVVVLVTLLALAIAITLPANYWGVAIEALAVSSLFATRSLHTHVAAVFTPLTDDNLASARQAVAHIVGRDPTNLDMSGVCRASIESLAENASDGVIAPLFWGVIFGLPGIAAYKAINTLDSMVGHRSKRYRQFGWASAKLDDVVNFIPARLTALLFLTTDFSRDALTVILRDAALHRSPNAGWPESALAGVLGVRLSGPRAYDGAVSDEPWVNDGCDDPGAKDLGEALRVYRLAMGIAAIALLTILFISL